MAKVKFQLDPNPTFKAIVKLPVHGGGEAELGFTFKHKRATEFAELFKVNENATKLDVVKDLCAGWDLAEPFTDENLSKMLENYIGSFDAIMTTYMDEIRQARVKN